MDLLSLLRTLLHFKWITLVVLGATVAGIAAFVVTGPKVYQVEASYVLVNPPLPSESELANSPALRRLNSNNPYLRFSNQAMVGQVVASRVGGNQVRSELIAAGADKDYVIAPSGEFGGSGQILQITGLGATPEAAARTGGLVTERMIQELRSMQKVYGADDRYLMTTLAIEPPGPPRQQTSGSMRSIMGIAGAGVLVLFMAISIAQAVEQARGQRVARAGRRGGRHSGGKGARESSVSDEEDLIRPRVLQ